MGRSVTASPQSAALGAATISGRRGGNLGPRAGGLRKGGHLPQSLAQCLLIEGLRVGLAEGLRTPLVGFGAWSGAATGADGCRRG